MRFRQDATELKHAIGLVSSMHVGDLIELTKPMHIATSTSES